MASSHLPRAELPAPSPVGARPRCAPDLIERNSHIDSAPFLWTFLVGTTQADGSICAVHDFYKVFTGDKVAYSSIQQWITPDLTDLLTDLDAHQ